MLTKDEKDAAEAGAQKFWLRILDEALVDAKAEGCAPEILEIIVTAGIHVALARYCTMVGSDRVARELYLSAVQLRGELDAADVARAISNPTPPAGGMH